MECIENEWTKSLEISTSTDIEQIIQITESCFQEEIKESPSEKTPVDNGKNIVLIIFSAWTEWPDTIYTREQKI